MTSQCSCSVDNKKPELFLLRDERAHFKLGTLGFSFKSKLSVEDVYTDTDSDSEIREDARCEAEIQRRFVKKDDNDF
ncbi:unnamed protein product [Euphydryas editha]|uniref:Uncharacterized protein n=1 Tax=Euphydryas editha TaxID=104508 RepID=A0AAU9TQW4_EUPED|nr:unnamed protein product [Euphydryas editha]